MKSCFVPPGRLNDWPDLAGFKRDRCSKVSSRNVFGDVTVRQYRDRESMLKACERSERRAELGTPIETPLEVK